MTEMLRSALPSTFAEWEAVLVRHFLRVGPDGDASPIRSFEVTAETLALASKVDGATPTDAEAAFKAAVLADSCLWIALREGRRRPATAAAPNCFTYLAITLLIDSKLEGDCSSQGQFRDRLRRWLGTTRSMMQLSGVAVMWRALAAWLEIRVKEGEPFRRLILPTPPLNWTQIGYTRRLSFPSRADLRFLDHAMAESNRGPSDIPSLLRIIGAAIQQGGASSGMMAAFEEFRTAFRAGVASSDHRFWRLVLRAARSVDRAEREEAVLELGFDEDARRLILLGSADEIAPLSVIEDLGTAMRSELVMRSANLAMSAMRGITFFRQVGMARWRAQESPPPGATGVHLAFSAVHAGPVLTVELRLLQSGDWYLTTEPVDQRTVDKVLLRLRFSRLQGEQLLDIALVGGVRVGSSWLGRKMFLPRIEAGDRRPTVTRVAGQDEGAQITIDDGRLLSRESVDGTYEVSAATGTDGEMAGWSRRIRFLANAAPHLELDGVAYNEPLVREWLACKLAITHTIRQTELEWSDAAPASADLQEAIYAAGRAGLSEAEVLDLIVRGADGRVEPWSILRTLQEGGFVEARHRHRWRGRVWTLVAPKLTVLDSDAPNTIVVEGALCAALEREFREVVGGLGGKPFRRLGVSAWAPAVVGATGVEPDQLAARLGWRVLNEVTEPSFVPVALERSDLIAEHHLLAASWDWDRRRFVTGTVAPCGVSLTRWVHPGGRDHDVYRVKSSRHISSHMTRNAAILMAHIVAQKPLFRVEGDKLVRTSKEGALPLEFAIWLRRFALAGGGTFEGGSYGYLLGGYDAACIARALPGCIEGVRQGNSTRASTKAMMAARRLGGRSRIRWVDGVMVATP